MNTTSHDLLPLDALADALERRGAGAEPDAGSVRAELFAAARGRACAPADHDALRRIAAVAAGSGDPAATEFAAAYAALCATAWGAAVPLSWPRRTAGVRLRVVTLHCPAVPVDAAMLAMLATLAPESFALTMASIGEGSIPALEGAASLVLPAQPDAGVARAIGAGDFDVLVDLAGLAAATGPLLAQRPARSDLDRRDIGVAERRAARRSPHRGHGGPGVGARGRAGGSGSAQRLRARSGCDGGRLGGGGARASARRSSALAAPLRARPGAAAGLRSRRVSARQSRCATPATATLRAGPLPPRWRGLRTTSTRGSPPPARPSMPASPDAAVALCDEGLARAPGDARLLRVAGLAQLARRDGAAAAAAFHAALLQDGAHGETHYNHGVALQMQGEFDAAAHAYRDALAFEPRLVAAHFNLGVLFQEQGATDDALAAYRTVLAAEPRNAIAYKNLGEVLYGAGRVDEWIANFRRFEAACPKALALAVQALDACQFVGDFPALERYLAGLAGGRFEPTDDDRSRRLPRGAALPAAVLRRASRDAVAASRRPTTRRPAASTASRVARSRPRSPVACAWATCRRICATT